MLPLVPLQHERQQGEERPVLVPLCSTRHRCLVEVGFRLVPRYLIQFLILRMNLSVLCGISMLMTTRADRSCSGCDSLTNYPPSRSASCSYGTAYVTYTDHTAWGWTSKSCGEEEALVFSTSGARWGVARSFGAIQLRPASSSHPYAGSTVISNR